MEAILVNCEEQHLHSCHPHPSIHPFLFNSYAYMWLISFSLGPHMLGNVHIYYISPPPLSSTLYLLFTSMISQFMFNDLFRMG